MKQASSPHMILWSIWWQNHQEKAKQKNFSRSCLIEKVFLEICKSVWGNREIPMGKSIGGSKNPCLNCLSLAHCKPTFTIFPQCGRRDEIWAFLNYLKYEIVLEEISKESKGNKPMPFIKSSYFSQNGIEFVNLICLAKSLKDSETVKSTSAVTWDN